LRLCDTAVPPGKFRDGNANYSMTASFKTVSNLLLHHSKNIKIRIYKTMIMPGVLYGCDIKGATYTEGVEGNIWTKER
jgi:hypothetical protein